jgi:hypothetical protein
MTKGTLRVVDMTDNKVMLDEQVGLSYGAAFGPDMADVGLWQEMCIKVVDGV